MGLLTDSIWAFFARSNFSMFKEFFISSFVRVISKLHYLK